MPRSTRDDLLIRVYGIHESVRAAAIAAGGGLTALVALHGSPRDALFAAGGVLVVSGTAGLLLRRHDASEAVEPGTLELLRGVPLLGWLPSVGLERLASKLTPLEVSAGAVLLREGEPGDLAYVIERGEVIVSIGDREIARLGPGDLVGEIALLHRVPRTATVVAASDLRVLGLDRSEFLVAATGAPDSRAAATALVSERLAQQRV